MSKKEKADYYREYDLFHCRKYKSQKPEAAHQTETIKKLNEWFKSKEFPSGAIVALPTGSGKTFTAVRFLCKYVLAKDYKVLWLAHTHHLLEQAFYSFGPLSEKLDDGYEVGWIPEPREHLNVRIVSGTDNHFNVSQIKPEDDVLIATLQSIANANKKDHPKFKDFLKSSNGKLFVVFDEAHHAPAPSYRNLILSLRKQLPQMYLLGLTATPTYMDVKKRGWLEVLFPQEIMHQVSVKNLIAQGILAKPVIKESETDFTPEFDESMYSKWVNTNKDLPESVVTQLAKNTARNQNITQYYINNKDTYQKTIIFADRAYQCDFISDFLNKNGVPADVMYSDQDNEKNAEVLDKFRNNELNVLVNIKMLTEGTDVPDVDTVFVTRQTTSLISMTQMVGRALRGPKFGGKPDAHLVFFQDDWQKAINWVTWDSKTWGPVKEVPDGSASSNGVSSHREMPCFSPVTIPSLYENDGSYPFLTFMPVGWYKVTVAEPDKDGNPEKVDKLVMVFENELESFEKLIEELKNEDITEFDDENVKLAENKNRLQKWCERFFPKSEKHFGNTLNNICDVTRHMAQNMKEPPVFIEFKERKDHDLESIAKKFIEEDYGPQEVDNKLFSEYKRKDRFWRAIYYDYSLFKSQYNGCVEWILHQNRHVNRIIENEEDNLVKKLEKGTVNEKIEACQILGDMGLEELIHEDTVSLLEKVSKNKENIGVKEAAQNALDLISRLTLDHEEKVKIKERDHYKCLCCGEGNKSYLQVDHVKSRWYELDNSEKNLQTLCKICNLMKSTDCIDFRKTRTELQKQPSEFHGINKLESLEPWEVRDLKWWEKFLKRSINFFYRCRAVKLVKIADRNPRWKVELHEGNDPIWLNPYMENLTQKARSIRREYGYTGPDEISVSNFTKGSYEECKLLIEQLKNESYPKSMKAANKLGNIGNKNAVGPLIKALKDPNRFVKKASARSLGKIGDKKAIKPLIQILSSKDSGFRKSAKEALVKLGASSEDLTLAFKSNNHYKREMALEALSEIGGKKSEIIIKKALSDESGGVRWRAAKAVLNCYDDNSVKILKNLSEEDPNFKVREESTETLEAIEEKVKNLFNRFEDGLKFISEDIKAKNIKEGKSFFSPEKKLFEAHFFNPYKIRFYVYQGKEKIPELDKMKDPEWGAIYLQREEDLGKVLEAVKKSYIMVKKDFNS